MIFKSLLNVNSLINNTLNVISNINKPQRDFFIEIMFLFLGIKGRLNFLQFARFGSHSEQRYRQQFEKQHKFLDFNKEIVLKHASSSCVLAFDPSYIGKSGKKTFGVDKFWSGVASQAKFGLEISGIAAIDIENNTAFHLQAVQTPTHETLTQKKITLLDWYADVIATRKDKLIGVSKYLVADAYFSKKPFVDQVLSIDMQLISRFRNDVDLQYLYRGEPTGKRGRRKKYSGKIDLKNIDNQYFECVLISEESTLYCAEVYSKALKRNIKLVYEKLAEPRKKSHLVFFSTDLSLDALSILRFYKSRFQIEFLYRDGKQYTGLNDCQARSENKLDFHFNASLTAINLAKVEHWLSVPKESRATFSMSDIKTMYHNALLLERFIKVFAINANKPKNRNNVKELINFGKIAA